MLAARSPDHGSRPPAACAACARPVTMKWPLKSGMRGPCFGPTGWSPGVMKVQSRSRRPHARDPGEVATLSAPPQRRALLGLRRPIDVPTASPVKFHQLASAASSPCPSAGSSPPRWPRSRAQAGTAAAVASRVERRLPQLLGAHSAQPLKRLMLHEPLARAFLCAGDRARPQLAVVQRRSWTAGFAARAGASSRNNGGLATHARP